jgi:3',5'-cyclic AMP phosphodiesterase CpdA
MTVIAHVSDLHFGSEEPGTAQALVDELNRESLDLVILSGDLTMAARENEFVRAMAFVRALKAPVLAVPGNHDITPYALAERFLAPYRRWRRHVGRELEPAWFGERTAVVGLNTARRMRLRLDWSHGSLSRRQIHGLAGRFAGAPDDAFRIVVAHHPFLAEVTEDLSGRPRAMVTRAHDALKAFAAERVDLVTAGHLHRTYAAQFGAPPTTGAVVAEEAADGHKVTVIQAGTALSSRTRGEPNSFNRIEIDGNRLAVHPVTWFGARWEREPDPLIEIGRHSHRPGASA